MGRDSNILEAANLQGTVAGVGGNGAYVATRQVLRSHVACRGGGVSE